MDLFNSPDFSDHVAELMKEWHVPGLAIAVVQDDEISAKGLGSAILEAGSEKPVTADTVFDIASSSKSLTAAAVALLVADDENYPQVQWDTPVSKLLPDDFVLAKKDYTDAVTVEDLVSHRTGLPRHDLSYLSPRAKEPDTPQSVTRSLRHLEIVAPIRTKHLYNNMAFTVLAYLVEKLSGLSFEEFLRTRIWNPLGMKSTNLQSKHALEAGLPVAQPYVWAEDKFVPVERQYSPEAIGAGLVITSVNDYAKWVRSWMKFEHPMTKEIFDALTKPRSFEEREYPEDPDPYTSPGVYCAGLGTYYYRGYAVVAHDGGDPGVASTHFAVPQINFGGVILGNSGGAGNVHPILMRELIDDALKVSQEERPDWLAREREYDRKDEEAGKEADKKRREELCPDGDGTEKPQPGSLERYTGRYWNDGYRGMTVEINNKAKLFIDATDRTMGFTLEFEHLCEGKKYIGHMSDYYEGGDRETAAEFIFDGDRVVKLGLDLEEDVPEHRIWFHRID